LLQVARSCDRCAFLARQSPEIPQQGRTIVQRNGRPESNELSGDCYVTIFSRGETLFHDSERVGRPIFEDIVVRIPSSLGFSLSLSLSPLPHKYPHVACIFLERVRSACRAHTELRNDYTKRAYTYKERKRERGKERGKKRARMSA